jgi:hypothetical protein
MTLASEPVHNRKKIPIPEIRTQAQTPPANHLPGLSTPEGVRGIDGRPSGQAGKRCQGSENDDVGE